LPHRTRPGIMAGMATPYRPWSDTLEIPPGWYACLTNKQWNVRFLQDGKSYLCEPAAFLQHCSDDRQHFDRDPRDVILVGPVSVYAEIKPLFPAKFEGVIPPGVLEDLAEQIS
jgi:hypothetical protein